MFWGKNYFCEWNDTVTIFLQQNISDKLLLIKKKNVMNITLLYFIEPKFLRF